METIRLNIAVLVLIFIASATCSMFDANDMEEFERDLVDLELEETKRGQPCNDPFGTSRCQKFLKFGFCAKDYRLKTLCAKTCGFCGRMPTVPHCAKTSLGCCWDETTPKQDSSGSNCPVCQDKPSTKRICRMFKDDCQSSKDAGKYMRNACPKTCAICGVDKFCTDDPGQKLFCPEWKKKGLCENQKAMMSVYCKKTCNLC